MFNFRIVSVEQNVNGSWLIHFSCPSCGPRLGGLGGERTIAVTIKGIAYISTFCACLPFSTRELWS